MADAQPLPIWISDVTQPLTPKLKTFIYSGPVGGAPPSNEMVGLLLGGDQTKFSKEIQERFKSDLPRIEVELKGGAVTQAKLEFVGTHNSKALVIPGKELTTVMNLKSSASCGNEGRCWMIALPLPGNFKGTSALGIEHVNWIFTAGSATEDIIGRIGVTNPRRVGKGMGPNHDVSFPFS